MYAATRSAALLSHAATRRARIGGDRRRHGSQVQASHGGLGVARGAIRGRTGGWIEDARLWQAGQWEGELDAIKGTSPGLTRRARYQRGV